MDTAIINIPTNLLQILSPDQALHYRVIPKLLIGNNLELYVSEDKSNAQIKSELELVLEKDIKFSLLTENDIQRLLTKYYRNNSISSEKIPFLSFNAKNGNFLNTIVNDARKLGSSDIHIEIYEEQCRVRIRIDGLLIERMTVGKNDYPSLVNIIKIQANLDISEKRLPQDGRIFYNDGSIKFDIRVSILPTIFGEKIVLRLLNNDKVNIDLNDLGFSNQDLGIYTEAIRRPHGLVLISGPTGSGKTTTLYATLKLLNQIKRNILTIEDPVEYTLSGINQVQVKDNIGLTFAAALRTFLRQDPDVIMLGEIRDAETAQMAIRAALTGHLVLSTIHTNSAWGTVSRLVDMGIPAYLLASTLNISIAQRLIRVLCPDCKRKEKVGHNLFPSGFNPSVKLEYHFLPTGCPKCYYTGYRGRRAIYEIIGVDNDISIAIKEGNFGIADILEAKGVNRLSDNALTVFNKGETSIEEIYPLLNHDF